MNIPFSPPDITQREIDLVVEALQSGWITTGPKTKEFEKKLAEYSGTPRFACLNSATAAMELVLRELGVGPGDEVIVPAYTYTATCSVVCHVGAMPVIVDISAEAPEMDYDVLDSYITAKTKAIMAVDLAGIICDYDKLYQCINRNAHKFVPGNEMQKAFGRIAVIGDSSHGFGAVKNGKRSGNFADFTCFSFHAVKNLTTAEGGAVTWKSRSFIDDESMYRDFMNLSLHGQTKDALNKNKPGAWEYDIVSPAYKCNMTDISAAIGLAQLERYENMLERRRTIIERYDEALSGFQVEHLNHYGEDFASSGHLYIFRIKGIEEDERNAVIEEMAENGVSTNVHYKPLPMLSAYKKLGFDIKDYTNAYNFYKGEITLPLYSKLTDEEVDYIIATLRKALERYKR